MVEQADVDMHRGALRGAAYRMLGTVADAEDAVQDAYVRWFRLDASDRAAVTSPGAWLMRTVGRICLDVLGSARVRRESYVGEWLPEPVPVDAAFTAGDPLAAAERAEGVSLALLRVMDALTPAERVVFVLHDVFALPFTEIADVVGRTPAACRQLAVAAREHVSSRPGAGVTRARHDEVVAAFVAASASGDLLALVRALDPEAVLVSDGGGAVSAARRPVRGADAVARFLLGLGRKQPTAVYEPIATGDGAGLAIRLDGAIVAVVVLATDADRVTDLWIMRNPDKLGAWK